VSLDDLRDYIFAENRSIMALQNNIEDDSQKIGHFYLLKEGLAYFQHYTFSEEEKDYILFPLHLSCSHF
jgi:hypothetical protein